MSYTTEFKTDAVARFKASDRTAKDFAKELGVADVTLYKWTKGQGMGQKGGAHPRKNPAPSSKPEKKNDAQIGEAIAFVAGRVIEICTLTAGRTGVSQRALTERVADLLRRSQNW